jgi:hypothetical protein
VPLGFTSGGCCLSHCLGNCFLPLRLGRHGSFFARLQDLLNLESGVLLTVTGAAAITRLCLVLADNNLSILLVAKAGRQASRALNRRVAKSLIIAIGNDENSLDLYIIALANIQQFNFDLLSGGDPVLLSPSFNYCVNVSTSKQKERYILSAVAACVKRGHALWYCRT